MRIRQFKAVNVSLMYVCSNFATVESIVPDLRAADERVDRRKYLTFRTAPLS
jgi:hypothetical protein